MIDAGSTDFSNLEIDGTLPDIGFTGWSDTLSLASVSLDNGILQRGIYLVESDLSLTLDAIEDGAVIIVGDDATLQLIANTGVLRVGDQGGARTAIVGRVGEDGDPGKSIVFGKFNLNGSIDAVVFNGVLLNYAPVREVTFNNVDVDLNSSNLQIFNSIDGRLQFNNCVGSVQDFLYEQNGGSIESPDIGLGQVGLFGSSMSIHGNQFGPVADGGDWVLKLHGTRAGASIHVADNQFDGTSQDAFPVRLDKSVGVLYGNDFQNLHHGAVTHTLSTGHYHRGAMNIFAGSDDLEPVIASLLLSESGEVNLFCGYNTFVRPSDWLASHKMVEYINQVPDRYMNWTNNHWAREDNEGHSQAELTGLELVPNSIDLGELLSYSPTFPWQYYPCNEDPLVPSQLLSQGLDAEALEDFETATNSYFTILAECSDSKEANEAIIRLKAIGLYTSYGEENYLDLRGSFAIVIPIMQVVDSHLTVFEQ